MPRLLSALLIVGLLSWMGVPVAQAQDDPQLPEIAPREFEIRGQAQVSFPSLERQPLRGFASPPSIPTLPPQRRPFVDVASYEQSLSGLPDRLPDDPALPSRLQTAPPPAMGSLTSSLGRYLFRSLDGTLSFPLSSTETLSLRGRYDGLSGHTPFEDADTETPYNTFDGAVQFATHREAVSFEADLHGFWDDYTLYGVDSPIGVPTTPSIPDRTGRSFGTTLALHTTGRLPLDLSLTFDRSAYETAPDTLQDPTVFDESRLAVDGGVSFPVGPTEARADASLVTAGLDGGAFAGDLVSFDGGGDALVVRLGPYRVRAGLRVLTFRAVLDPSRDDSGDASATFIAPTFDARWRPLDAVEVYARNAPHVRTPSLPDVYQQNPFIEAQPSVRPTLETTNAETGVTVSTGPVRWTAYGGFRYAPSYAFFEPGLRITPTSNRLDGVFQASYDGVQVWRGGGQVALEGTESIQSALRIELRDATLTDTERAVPNVAGFILENTTTVAFLDDAAQIDVAASVEGPRYVDRQETEQVDAFVDLDVTAAYRMLPGVDVRLGLHNLGAMERWNGYPRPPAVITTGFRLHW